MPDTTRLYRHSAQEARELDELDLWRESYKANCACCAAIEETIRNGFDGMHLADDCARKVIEAFGYQRVEYVLANTLQELSHDGRFSPSNKEWGDTFYIPRDPNHNFAFTVSSHPTILDGFIDEYRSEYQKLGLFEAKHCVENAQYEDFTGKVLVMKARSLKEKYWDPKYQLWHASSGFGCDPSKLGTAVYVTCLYDGERTRFSRSDFFGPIRDECLPDWAKDQLEKLKAGQALEPLDKQQPEMTM